MFILKERKEGIYEFQNEFHLSSRDVMLHQASIGFDASIEEIYPILSVGGCIAVIDKKKMMDEIYMKDFLTKHKVSVLSVSYRYRVLPTGKPEVIGESGLHISLSHTRMCVATCVSEVGAVGIDVEKIGKFPEEIIKECFHPEEIKEIFCKEEKEKNKYCYELWTCKEAFLKQLGCGITNRMSSKSVFEVNKNRFFIWSDDGYQFACYSGEYEPIDYKKIGEKDIVNFYLTC